MQSAINVKKEHLLFSFSHSLGIGTNYFAYNYEDH